MPVTYDGSSLLKCTVAMTYLRYILNMAVKTESDTSDSDTDDQPATSPNAHSLGGQHAFNLDAQGWVKDQTGLALNFVVGTVDNPTLKLSTMDVA